MYKINIKEALYPILIVSVVFKKFSQTSVFIDRKWPIRRFSDLESIITLAKIVLGL